MDRPAPDAPYHAHIYCEEGQRAQAVAFRAALAAATGEDARPLLLMVGPLSEGPLGPHPIPQFEIHFLARDLPQVRPMLEACGLRVLVHPLTHDDLADHTTLGQWIGEPIELNLGVLDPPGGNKGFARFGVRDF